MRRGDWMITEKVGIRIKELRSDIGWSQEKLTLKAGLDRTYVAGVENGKRNISIKNLEKIVLALETNMKDFFSGMGD